MGRQLQGHTVPGGHRRRPTRRRGRQRVHQVGPWNVGRHRYRGHPQQLRQRPRRPDCGDQHLPRDFNVTSGVTGAVVDIPYEITGITAAPLQGAYGSNKDVRDFSFDRATATLYTIAQIADVGNQLLRQSNGAAEASARRRLGRSFGIARSPVHHQRHGQLPAARLLPGLLGLRRPGRVQDDPLIRASVGGHRSRHRGAGDPRRRRGTTSSS